MGGHKSRKETRVSSTEKENRPPKKGKHTVSVASLFGKRRQLASKPTGISKQTPPKSRSSIRLKESKTTSENPLLRDFSRATRNYRQVAKESGAQSLELAYQDLLTRVDEATLTEEVLCNAGLSNVGVERLTYQARALFKPLEDETSIIEGNSQEVKLGSTMRAFEKLLEKKRSRLGRLLEDLRELEEEIAVTKESVLKTERQAKRELDATLQSLVQEAQDAKDRTMSEIEQARNDEKVATLDERRKVDSFMKQLP